MPTIRRSVVRRPGTVKDDSDLGDLAGHGRRRDRCRRRLSPKRSSRGEAEAQRFSRRGLIHGAVLLLAGRDPCHWSASMRAARDRCRHALIEIRGSCVTIEEIRHEFGPPPDVPQRRGSICAVLDNPYAGRYVRGHPADDGGAEAGGPRDGPEAPGAPRRQGIRRSKATARAPSSAASGELEHGALWHVPGRLCDARSPRRLPRPSCRRPRRSAGPEPASMCR